MKNRKKKKKFTMQPTLQNNFLVNKYESMIFKNVNETETYEAKTQLN